MSDSDDTDVLLLIPPNFFLVDDSEPPSIESYSRVYSTKNKINSMSKNFMLPISDNQLELNNINARISQIERNFSAPSDISSISNPTIRSNFHRNNEERRLEEDIRSKTSPIKFVHSTPKYSFDSKQRRDLDENGVIREIDQYLNTKLDPWCGAESHNTHNTLRTHEQPPLLHANTAKYYRTESIPCHYSSNRPSETQLLSLQELWGNNGLEGSNSVQEERLRRQHCEKTIKALQEKLLEYQQKISVAIQIDRSKDAAIEELKLDNIRIKDQNNQLVEKVQLLESGRDDVCETIRKENTDLKIRNENLEKELSQALDLVNKFQNKNEALEVKVDELNKAYAEVEEVYKEKIEDLEKRMLNYQQLAKIDAENVNQIKEKLKKVENDAELTRAQKSHTEKQNELLQGEIELLKQQKQNIFEKYREEKERITLLEKQNKSFQQMTIEFSEKEKKLTRDLDLQRTSLKSHYQKQLEEVVSQKLKEFQMQLDHVEESLKSEAKERECLIAERAIKQIELINDKNEQEIRLLTEKHHEESELYRIQLQNSVRKIEELEEKLNLYKSRRADIAEKLHSVMEAQWKKALEILTSPSANVVESFQSINTQNMDPDTLDGVNSQKSRQQPENELFDTPTSSRNKKHDRSKSRERLHAYIELLLNKSPKDFENLEEILMSKESSHQTTKCEKLRHKMDSLGKPPWK